MGVLAGIRTRAEMVVGDGDLIWNFSKLLLPSWHFLRIIRRMRHSFLFNIDLRNHIIIIIIMCIGFLAFIKFSNIQIYFFHQLLSYFFKLIFYNSLLKTDFIVIQFLLYRILKWLLNWCLSKVFSIIIQPLIFRAYFLMLYIYIW